jgi:hypothetical protein
VSTLLTTPHTLTKLQTIGEGPYRLRVNGFVQDFITSQALPNHRAEDVRAVVIMGEASSAAVEELATAALAAVGTNEVKLMTQFHHTEVVAHGAAVFSRIVQEDPGSFSGPSDHLVIPDEEYWAEEEARAARKVAKAEEHSEL